MAKATTTEPGRKTSGRTTNGSTSTGPTKKASTQKASTKKASTQKVTAKKPSATKVARTAKSTPVVDPKAVRDARARLEEADRKLATIQKLEDRVTQKLSADAQRARNVKKSLRASEDLLDELDERLAQAKDARKEARKKLRKLAA